MQLSVFYLHTPKTTLGTWLEPKFATWTHIWTET